MAQHQHQWKSIRKLAPKANAVKAIGDTRGYLVITSQLSKGENHIEISASSGKMIEIEGLHITGSAYPKKQKRSNILHQIQTGKLKSNNLII